MDTKQLRALIAVAETGSVTRAAEILHIVQPAVSRQLRLLEDDVGVALLTRGRYGMRVTDAGEKLVEYARHALDTLERAREELQPKSDVSGLVTIGLLQSTAPLLATVLVSRVAQRYPGVRLRILTGYTGHLRQWLETGEVDAALLYDSKPSPTVHLQALLDERLVAVGEPGKRFLTSSRPMSLKKMAGMPIVLPSTPHGIRTMVEQHCAILQIRLNIVAETDSVVVQKQLVRAGVGVTILPSIAVSDEAEQGHFGITPFSDENMQRRIVLAVPTTRRAPLVVKSVINILIDEMYDAVQNGRWPTARWIGDKASAYLI